MRLVALNGALEAGAAVVYVVLRSRYVGVSKCLLQAERVATVLQILARKDILCLSLKAV